MRVCPAIFYFYGFLLSSPICTASLVLTSAQGRECQFTARKNTHGLHRSDYRSACRVKAVYAVPQVVQDRFRITDCRRAVDEIPIKCTPAWRDVDATLAASRLVPTVNILIVYRVERKLARRRQFHFIRSGEVWPLP
jgi:hypothetical protein